MKAGGVRRSSISREYPADLGTLLYRSGGAGAQQVTVQWLDGAGNVQPLLATPGDYAHPSLSPDGRRLALSLPDGVWIYEPQRGNMTRLTHGLGDMYPIWTPDGRYIAFRRETNIF